jgi:1-deoxy-D-xylulose-5-phosphate reductoisomerase
MKRVAVFGATGSVADSVLAVLRANPDRFEVIGLAAGGGGAKFLALAAEFPGAALALADGGAAAGREFPDRRFFHGAGANQDLLDAVAADVAVLAISGAAGLPVAFAAARRGLRILLANKEVLASAGSLFLALAAANGAEVIPLDSEHSALHQCLRDRDPDAVERLALTASGGPFRTWPVERIAEATPEDALNHPIWKMGPKISVDSATLANKALEVMEAHHLFSMPYQRILVLVHPQSAIHGMVEFRDGSWLAHLGRADMRLAAHYALFHPQVGENDLPRLNPLEFRQLTFEEPRNEAFPLLSMGVDAGKAGDRGAACFNAANERAVSLFLKRKLRFSGIAPAVAHALEREQGGEPASLDEILDLHARAAAFVDEFARGSL